MILHLQAKIDYAKNEMQQINQLILENEFSDFSPMLLSWKDFTRNIRH